MNTAPSVSAGEDQASKIGFVWYYTVTEVDEVTLEQSIKVRKAKLRPTRTGENWLCSVFTQFNRVAQVTMQPWHRKFPQPIYVFFIRVHLRLILFLGGVRFWEWDCLAKMDSNMDLIENKYDTSRHPLQMGLFRKNGCDPDSGRRFARQISFEKRLVWRIIETPLWRV